MTDFTTITCSICKQELPATAEYFCPRPGRRRGFRSQCRTCERAEMKRRYHENPQKQRDRQNDWRSKNPDKVHVIRRRWDKKHPDAKRAKNKKWRQKYPEKVKKLMKKWQLANPVKMRMNYHKRKARKCSLPTTFTSQDWQQALEYFHGCCAYCSNPPSMFDLNAVLHQDHFKPLSQGGAYTPDNIVPACQSCNLGKHDKMPELWLIERFGKRKTKVILKRIRDYFSSL